MFTVAPMEVAHRARQSWLRGDEPQPGSREQRLRRHHRFSSLARRL